MEHITNQLEREINGITSNEQNQFKKEFSIRVTEFEAWWETIDIQALQKTIKQHVIHFGYPKMHLVSHISESIRRMGSGDIFTPDIFERLHIANVKQGYQSHNKVDYIGQMFKHNDQVTGRDYMERHCHILHSKTSTILTQQEFSTFCALSINGEVHAEPICYVAKQFRMSPLSALSHSRYIIEDKCMSTEWAEVSN